MTCLTHSPGVVSGLISYAWCIKKAYRCLVQEPSNSDHKALPQERFGSAPVEVDCIGVADEHGIPHQLIPARIELGQLMGRAAVADKVEAVRKLSLEGQIESP